MQRLRRALGAAALSACAVGAPGVADILRVPEDYPTIQAAVDAAMDGDEILVGPGTYRERIVIFQKGITLTGREGYAQTIIDGEELGRVITMPRSAARPHCILRGLTMVRGFHAETGGGMFGDGVQLTMSSCRLAENSAGRGGGIYIDGYDEVQVDHCLFEHNQAEDGSGMYIDVSDAAVHVEHSTFSSNAGYGALYLPDEGPQSEVISCVFRANDGPGLFTGTESQTTIVDCLFEKNHHPGGTGGGLVLGWEAHVVMAGCIARGNSARFGGGIGSYAHPFVLRDCVIEDNFAEAAGGGLSWDTGAATLERCIIRFNQAEQMGGGICGFEGSYGDDSIFTGCLIAGNEASLGPQIGLAGAEYNDTLTISDCAIEGGQALIHLEPGWQLIWGEGNTSRIPADLLSTAVAYGTHISGGLAEVLLSDDTYLRARSRFGFASAEPNVVDVHIAAENLVTQPAELDFTLEARLNHNGGTCRVRLRNWSSAQFIAVHTYSIGTAEIVEAIEAIPAVDYVRMLDNRIDLSLRTSVMTVFSSAGFETFHDLVEVRTE